MGAILAPKDGFNEFVLVFDKIIFHGFNLHLVNTPCPLVALYPFVSGIEVEGERISSSNPFSLRYSCPVRLFSVIHRKVCPPALFSDAVLFFCGQVSGLIEIFCFLPFITVTFIDYSSIKVQPFPHPVVMWYYGFC